MHESATAAEYESTVKQIGYKHKWGQTIALFLLDSWPLKMGPVGCPETSVMNCYYMLRNAPEERSYHLLRGGSRISHTNDDVWNGT
jgi:hypothetical protein